MKKTSKLIGVAFMLLATIGAFASSKLVRTQVFYQNTLTGLCQQVWAEHTCEEGAILNCEEELYLESDGGTFFTTAQIYADVNPSNPAQCINPYERP